MSYPRTTVSGRGARGRPAPRRALVRTIEIAPPHPARAAEARANLDAAALSAYATVHTADAAAHLAALPDDSLDLVVLDGERGEYAGYWAHLPRVLRARAVIAVDNAISHAEEVAAFTALLDADPAFATALHRVGDGVLTAVRTGSRAAAAPSA